LLPLRVFPERRFPADWSLPGHCPAHDARCPAEGEHAHVDADLGDQQLSGPLLHTRDRAQQLSLRGERAHLVLDRRRDLVDLGVEEVQVGKDRADQDGVQRLKPALQCLS